MTKKKERKTIAWFEIFVMIVATISFSYLAHESTLEIKSDSENGFKINPLIIILKIAGKIIFSGKGIVSAAAAGVYTCQLTKDGKICIGYPTMSECSEKCDGECVPNPSDMVADCKIGSCFDMLEGTCQLNSPKKECESNGGKWLNDANGNTQECRKGCCINGNNADFVTEQRCTRISALLGVEKNFKPEIRTELECIAQSQAQTEGACITGKEVTGKNTCKFTTKSECLKVHGEFHEGYLCSTSELNTNCEKQKTASCVEGKDEVYWFDSCGNRENIYDANKVKSWNDGKMLTKNQSCAIGTLQNPTASQRTCGNCNYLMGSKCGNKTATEKLSDNTQNFVCRDLSCIDEKGNKRAQGESWCAYRGSVGVDNGKRAMDTPGSEYFKKICMDGEIRTEACADHRNGICFENQMEQEGGGKFSSAECITNPWQMCLEYNGESDGTKECGKNDFCFVKSVNVDKNFQFSLCAPKHPGGHNLQTGEGAIGCAMASQKCTVVYVKTYAGKWECKANCDCEKAIFTQEMNDLCMSMGDCGAEVNYLGDLSLSYTVKKAPSLSSSYLNQIKAYSNQKKGDVATPGLGSYGGSSIGIPGGLGEGKEPKDPTEGLKILSEITGGAGALILLGVHAGWIGTAGTAATATAKAVPASSVAGAMSAVAGAAIGFAIVNFFIKSAGIGAGLDPWLAYTLMAMGTFSGAVLGSYFMGASWATGGLLTAAIWVAAVVVVVIIIFKLRGVGKTKKKIVEFKCYPWEPPLGGKGCDRCGKDGLPCSVYACQSLGQTCKLVNEDTPEQKCIDSSPNDITPPVIKARQEPLGENYEFANENELGVKLKSKTSADGCIDSYSLVNLGLKLNKNGRCRYDTNPGIEFNSMQDYFGDNVFRENLSMSYRMPTMEELGIPSYDPNRRADANVYVRCQNANGDASARDYVINICIKPANDTTPPIVNKIVPGIDYIKFDADKRNTTVFTNEPADCRWDSANKDYSLMANNFSCANDIEEQTVWGWACIGEMAMPLRINESTFYIRCEDKPWAENESRNSDTESKALTLTRTKKLEIYSASPDNRTITSGVEPVSVVVEAKTSGGIEGQAECFYSFNGESYIEFFNTWSSIHTQTFESFTAGEKLIMLKCTDLIDNLAYRKISFNVEIDRQEPQIARIFYDSGSLIIKTTENSQCALSTSSCEFDFSNGTLMNGDEISHSAGVDKGVRYYVKCKDELNNMKGTCNAAVKVT